MYTVTKNIKIFSFTLMAIGFIGLFYGFYTAPHSIEESNAIVASYGDHGHSSDHELILILKIILITKRKLTVLVMTTL